MTMVAEGHPAAKSIYARVKKMKQIKQTPIISSTYNILFKEKDPKTQLKKLEKLISWKPTSYQNLGQPVSRTYYFFTTQTLNKAGLMP